MNKFSFLKLILLLRQIEALLDQLDVEYIAIKRNKKK
jgi:hypothetical protein